MKEVETQTGWYRPGHGPEIADGNIAIERDDYYGAYFTIHTTEVATSIEEQRRKLWMEIIKDWLE